METKLADNVKAQIVLQELTQLRGEMYRTELRFRAQKKLVERLGDESGNTQQSLDAVQKDMERVMAMIDIYEEELAVVAVEHKDA
jgi:hypothetical protein